LIYVPDDNVRVESSDPKSKNTMGAGLWEDAPFTTISGLMLGGIINGVAAGKLVDLY